ncbi:MAG: flagellar biosynthesis anti-sigma factor FlgM [Bdellovibrionales bacterium]|nr:flagellar biosynthesis anti-sigma factor FlgM [Bdellovibrionales bacterium]
MKIKSQLAEKIEKIRISNTAQEEAQRLKTEQQAVQTGKKVDSDTVSLSLAKQIQTELLEPNHKKIERIKSLIADGSYDVSSTTLAEKLVGTIEDEIFFQRLEENE